MQRALGYETERHGFWPKNSTQGGMMCPRLNISAPRLTDGDNKVPFLPASPKRHVPGWPSGITIAYAATGNLPTRETTSRGVQEHGHTVNPASGAAREEKPAMQAAQEWEFGDLCIIYLLLASTRVKSRKEEEKDNYVPAMKEVAFPLKSNCFKETQKLLSKKLHARDLDF